MDKEIFNKFWEIIQDIPIDDWTMEHKRGDCVVCRPIRIREDGHLFVFSGDRYYCQRLSYFQKRKLRKHYYPLEAEIALRATQRELSVA